MFIYSSIQALAELNQLQLIPGSYEAELAEEHREFIQRIIEDEAILDAIPAEPADALSGSGDSVKLPFLSAKLVEHAPQAGKRVIKLIDINTGECPLETPFSVAGLRRAKMAVQKCIVEKVNQKMCWWQPAQLILTDYKSFSAQYEQDCRNLGNAIKTARKARELSRLAVTKALKIEPGSLARIEEGRTLPTIVRLHLIADLLDVKPFRLLNMYSPERRPLTAEPYVRNSQLRSRGT